MRRTAHEEQEGGGREVWPWDAVLGSARQRRRRAERRLRCRDDVDGPINVLGMSKGFDSANAWPMARGERGV